MLLTFHYIGLPVWSLSIDREERFHSVEAQWGFLDIVLQNSNAYH